MGVINVKTYLSIDGGAYEVYDSIDLERSGTYTIASIYTTALREGLLDPEEEEGADYTITRWNDGSAHSSRSYPTDITSIIAVSSGTVYVSFYYDYTSPSPGDSNTFIYTNGNWHEATVYIYSGGTWHEATPDITT